MNTRCRWVLTLVLGTGGAHAEVPANQTQAQAKESKPFDHGEDANASLMEFAQLPQVPVNPPARPLAPLELKDKIYHGALINTDTWTGFKQRYEQYVEVAGAKPTMLGTFLPIFSAGTESPENALPKRLRMIDSIPNTVPFVKLSTSDWKTTGPFLKADDILSGKEDARFIRLAEQSKTFGKPCILSLNHEMNGNWFAYSELYRRQPTDWTAEKYKLVWRHVRKIFKDQGATQVVFAWCPAANGVNYKQFDALNSYKAYYPGDDAVDWVGASFYNSRSQYALDNLAATYPNKPMILAEWGTEAPRSKWYTPPPYPGDAAWMNKTFEFMKRYPNMKAITYFYWNKGVFIERVPEQVEIYRKWIRSPMYYSNQ